ncbi:MAG: VWA domain-containing protein, partial [Anaerolineaceae bacterium]|nr:VWA domain-containing protein [Anaerolineaceae bacterium]
MADLTPSDLKLLEDDQPVPVETLTITPDQIDKVRLVLAVDTSMAPADFAPLKAGATDLAAQITNQDDLALIRFADQAEVVREFTNNRDELQRVIEEEFQARGSATAVNNAIIAAADLLAPDQAGRHAVVIVTDRHQNVQGPTLAETINRAKETNVPFYIIGFGDQVQFDHP